MLSIIGDTRSVDLISECISTDPWSRSVPYFKVSILLEKLLNDDRYETIKLFSRKEIDGLPSKVQQFIGDILELENFKKDFTADEVYCCIGTTAKKTP